MIRVVSVDKRFSHLHHLLHNINFDVRALENVRAPGLRRGLCAVRRVKTAPCHQQLYDEQERCELIHSADPHSMPMARAATSVGKRGGTALIMLQSNISVSLRSAHNRREGHVPLTTNTTVPANAAQQSRTENSPSGSRVLPFMPGMKRLERGYWGSQGQKFP
jgi:hypothetical protein